MKKLLMLLIMVGMLIGAGCDIEQEEPNEPDFITTFPPITKVDGGRDWEDVIYSMQENEGDSTQENKQKGAATYAESVAEYLRKQEIREHDEALAEAEREFDEVLRVKREKEARIRKEKEIADRLIVKQSMFGIFLGQTLDSLRHYCSSGLRPSDDDHPGMILQVHTSNPSVKRLLAWTFNTRIYRIDVQFKDGGKTNYEAIKTQLEKKYKDNDDSLFGSLFGEVDIQATIDGVEVHINLNHDIGFMEDDKLELTYVHKPLFQQLHKEIQKRKIDKIGDEL